MKLTKKTEIKVLTDDQLSYAILKAEAEIRAGHSGRQKYVRDATFNIRNLKKEYARRLNEKKNPARNVY